MEKKKQELTEAKTKVNVEAVVSKILVGYDAYLVDSKDYNSRSEANTYVKSKQADGKITDHIRYCSMEIGSKYLLIVYEDVNDNQYYANDGLAPNKIKKVGMTGKNLIYMVIER